MRHALALLATALVSACASASLSSGVPSQAMQQASTAASRLPPVPQIARPEGESAAWWFHAGAASAARQRGGSGGEARNLILFLGDGMSIPTLAAARILGGQRQGHSGEEFRLAFEDFPHSALSRTYNTDAQTPDSAGTMSAITTGAKTKMGFISVGQGATRGDCASSRGHELVTLLELAESAGLATGVVTTTRLTHATPAATYAHVPDRNWENDVRIPADERAHGCADIARQLIEFPFGDGIDLAMGGGRVNFLPAENPDGAQGARQDGRNLVAEWLARPQAVYVTHQEQLAALDASKHPQVLGLFADEHMQYDHDRRENPRGEPSLAEMTRAAITLLKDRPNGYVLVIEGGRIDHAHHAGNAYRALDDTLALSDAVHEAARLTSADDTLIMVTADHAHTMNIVGYPARGNPILGLVRSIDARGELQPHPSRDSRGLPYTTLSYANGPGHSDAADLSETDTAAADFRQPSTYPLSSETHGGDDVAVFARGPGAAAVRGSLEQNTLFHLLVQAQPQLRAQLCSLSPCEADGIPFRLPSYQQLRDAGQPENPRNQRR